MVTEFDLKNGDDYSSAALYKLEKEIEAIPSPVCKICNGKGMMPTQEGHAILELVNTFYKK